MAQIQSLMRAVINFYNFNNRNAPVVITRVKEQNSERMCMDRLERAILISCDEDCKATPSRYAIWGEDVRSISISAKEAMKNGNIEQAEKLMDQIINSMGAFIDAQLILSNLPGNISFVKSKDIIKSYITSLLENNEVSDPEKDDLIASMKETMKSIE